MKNNNNEKEFTYIMLKPDGVKKNLLNEIVRRFENNDLKVVTKKTMILDKNNKDKTFKFKIKWSNYFTLYRFRCFSIYNAVY